MYLFLLVCNANTPLFRIYVLMGVPVSRMERPSPVSALLSIKVADWSPLQPPDVTVTCRKVLPDCLVSLPLLAVSELWPVCPRQQQDGPLPVHRSDSRREIEGKCWPLWNIISENWSGAMCEVSRLRCTPGDRTGPCGKHGECRHDRQAGLYHCACHLWWKGEE